MLICGVSIREVDGLDDYKRSFSDRTVMTNYFNAAGPEAEPGVIDRATWLAVAHEHNVPCHLDAAADVPPISNLWNYTAMGFDLVCFSGGKGLRGPQNAGLLLGKKKLTDLALANDSPISDAVGRGMKVAKEQMVGMVAAVDWILDQNDDALQAECMRRVDRIRAALTGIPSLTTSINVAPGGQSRSSPAHPLRSRHRRHQAARGRRPPARAEPIHRTQSCHRRCRADRRRRPEHHRRRRLDA